MIVVLVVVAVIVVVAIVVLVRRREPDTLDSFRRQIDALSPEARRPVVDQVQRLEDAEARQDDRPGEGVDESRSAGDPGPGADAAEEDDHGA